MNYKNVFIGIIALGFLVACQTKKDDKMKDNPFAKESTLAYGFPDFSAIKAEHYMPAFEEGIAQKYKEIDAITANKETPTFANTIVALERSGELLTRVSSVFYNLTSAETNDELKQIQKDLAPILSKLTDDINMNEALFERIKAVKESEEGKALTGEDAVLLDDYYKKFTRGGANLNDEDKEKLRKINEELSLLSIEFGDNVLNENNTYKLVVTDEKDLAGLSEDIIAQAKITAEENNETGWVFTLHNPSVFPFLQYAKNRDLREKIYKAYINKGNNNDANDNKDIIKKLVNLRIEKANLLGYTNHASYVLENNVAKTPENVKDLLGQLWQPALKRAKSERAKMQRIIRNEGGKFKLQGWDWWYYAEKVKAKEYALNEEEMRPYFKLENVRNGAFALANKLFGINFTEMTNLKGYHPDVKVFEVTEADGNHIGIYLVDYFPRPGKRSGAWMNSYRKQSNLDGNYVTPIIVNVCNFTKPIGDNPALLSLDETLTLFHEFGHALHGLLSNTTYRSQSGTAVPRDFVEYPSQVTENWATQPELMKLYAKHYQTGEVMPNALIAKINNAGKFNQGFATTEYLAASLLDMQWHTLTEPFDGDVNEFEDNFLKKDKGLLPEINSRYSSTYFQHVFSGGYSAGYYSYIWSEVFDADTFNYFKETNIFDKEKGEAYRKYILSKGGTEDPEVLYEKFRGAKPTVKALIEKRGLN